MKKLIFALLMVVPVTAYSASVTKTIRADGTGDYNNLATAVAAMAGDYTGDTGGSITFRIEGEFSVAEASATVIDGYTFGASSGMLIITTGSARHSGKFTNTAFRIETAKYVQPISISESYCVIDGLQVSQCLNEGNYAAITITNTNSNGNANNTIRNCIIYKRGNNAAERSGIFLQACGLTYIYNNLFLNFAKYGTYAPAILTDYAAKSYIYNNTCIDTQFTGSGDGTDSVYKNNLVAMVTISSDCYTGGDYDAVSDGNASTDATSPDASYRNVSPSFTNSGTGDFSITSDIAGLNLYADAAIAMLLDIKGTSRPNAAQSIGAFQYTSGGGGTPAAFPQILIFQ